MSPVTYFMADFFRCVFAFVSVCDLFCGEFRYLRVINRLMCDASCAACGGLALCFPTTLARDRCVIQHVLRLWRDSNEPVFQVCTFQTTTTAGGDEGVRLWVDGQLLVDAWATSRLRHICFAPSAFFMHLQCFRFF